MQKLRRLRPRLGGELPGLRHAGERPGPGKAREKAKELRVRLPGKAGGAGGTYTYDGSRRDKYAESYDADVRENQGLGYLCYLGPLLVIPLLLKPKSRFLRYHCNQGLLLLIFAALVSICDGFAGIGWLIGIAGSIASVIWLIQGLVNVSKGVRRPLPLIGEITILK